MGEECIEKIKINCTMWNSVSEDGNFIFPELNNDLTDRSYNTNGVGLAFSGGGSIAYTAGIGYLRALHKLNIKNTSLYDLTQFISGVSGGSWFSEHIYLQVKSLIAIYY
uniref:PLA2c domain-containing protein n=1 Tax=viral metagenome TaxID=1070528 RepID=A0A6C0KLS9_9ZZZZ